VWDEWLALTFALDSTVAPTSTSDSAKGGDAGTTPTHKYAWFQKKGKGEYAALLLQRRKEMLKLNLTHNPDLQIEWVVLVRELEALAYRSPVTPTMAITPQQSPKIQITCPRTNMKGGERPSSTSRHPAINRILFKDNRLAPESVDRGVDISRATSLASFYSEACDTDTEASYNNEDWYSQAESSEKDTEDYPADTDTEDYHDAGASSVDGESTASGDTVQGVVSPIPPDE